jgi:hypothetical protein
VLKVIPVHKELQDPKELLGHKVLPDPKVILVTKELQVPKVILVHKEILVPKELMELPDQVVLLVETKLLPEQKHLLEH